MRLHVWLVSVYVIVKSIVLHNRGILTFGRDTEGKSSWVPEADVTATAKR